MSDKEYDVFLSHHRADKPAVEIIARKLRSEGIKPFLDKWHLVPGDPWQEALERALNESAACAVFLGSHGLGPWEHEEMRTALNRRTRDPRFRVIPVILPGMSTPAADLPPFLTCLTWVEFRSGLEDADAFWRLCCGVRSQKPEPIPSGINPRAGAPVAGDRPPYRGIETFRTEDADLFFGRAALTRYLIERLRNRRFLAVIGPSGSGKSSLVRAGLIPALRRGKIPGSETWKIVILRPGNEPLQELAAELLRDLAGPETGLYAQIKRLSTAMGNNPCALAAEVRRKASSQILLVVDQFEEVFASTSSDSERQAFFDNLLDASSLVSGKIAVVIILRADFYARVAAYPDLSARIAERQVLVTPMQDSDVWEAICEPAALSGLIFEEGLVDKILHEMHGQTEALPLLQQSLLEIWKLRQGNTLTFAAYEAVGGVKGAIAGWADSVYKGLTTRQQALARRIFLELVEPGDDTKDTRRRVLRRSLRFGEAIEDEEILEILIRSRLLLTDSDIVTRETLVEIAHESLLQEWPVLNKWLGESKQFRLTKSNLQKRSRQWEEYKRSPDILARGLELKNFEGCSQQHPEEISPLEEQYLAASIEARDGAVDTKSRPTMYANVPSRKPLLGSGGGPILEVHRPWDLSATGWAVVFAPNLDPRVRLAMEELLEFRRSQATSNGHSHYYKELNYQGESTADFLRRNGAKIGMMADPNHLPYYLLLVGDPESLPFRFQSELDVNYAVGRIYFDQVDDYTAYARNVILTEVRDTPRPREVAFFGTAHKNDPASQLITQELLHKLAESVRELTPTWTVQEAFGAQATKERLRALLGGPETPALLFTACHGLGIDDDDDRQASCQGALVCQDWSGPNDEDGVSANQWFAASDVAEAATLQGLVAFFYSCYSLGTPQHDDFDQTPLGRPRRVAPKAFVSQLPQKLLAHKNGGMLAIIGHVDRSWTSAIEGSPEGEGIGPFRYMLQRLLHGHTVGWAMEYLNQTYASLAAMHGNMEERLNREGIDRELAAHLWRLRNDARNFMVFGDPAVRLPGVGEPR